MIIFFRSTSTRGSRHVAERSERGGRRRTPTDNVWDFEIFQQHGVNFASTSTNIYRDDVTSERPNAPDGVHGPRNEAWGGETHESDFFLNDDVRSFGRSAVVLRSFGGWRSAADSKHDLGKTLVIIVVIHLPFKLVRKAKPELSMNTNQIKNKTKMKWIEINKQKTIK